MDNMGGVYTAPTSLILLYLSGIERALLLSFHNNALYALLERAPSSISPVSQASLAWRTRALSPVFYCISCIIVTLTLWYLTHQSLSGHSTWVTDMLPWWAVFIQHRPYSSYYTYMVSNVLCCCRSTTTRSTRACSELSRPSI